MSAFFVNGERVETMHVPGQRARVAIMSKRLPAYPGQRAGAVSPVHADLGRPPYKRSLRVSRSTNCTAKSDRVGIGERRPNSRKNWHTEAEETKFAQAWVRSVIFRGAVCG